MSATANVKHCKILGSHSGKGGETTLLIYRYIDTHIKSNGAKQETWKGRNIDCLGSKD
jgi:hypothetical protein